MTLREATRADLELVRELWEELYDTPAPEHRRRVWEDVEGDIRRYVDENVVLLAEEDRAAAGFVVGWPEGDDVGYVGLLYVRPPFRRRGIGRELVREAAARLGRRFVTLSVDAHDQDARAFYGRLGFREDSVNLVVERGRLAPAAEVGPSFGSVHVQTDDIGRVATAVRQFVPRLPGRSQGTVVAPPRNGWVAVYDELCDREPKLLARLARELSDRMGAVTLAIGVEEGRVVHYLLYERGRMVDEYLSVPEHYGELPPGDVIALGANPTVVARLTGAEPSRVREVARTARSPSELPPAPELLAMLADVMGIEGAEHGYAGAAQLSGATSIR